MKTSTFSLVLFVVFTISIASHSQNDTSNPLSFLIGSWDVEEYIAPGVMGPEREGKGEATSNWGPGQNSVIIDYHSIAGPMSGFRLTEFVAKGEGDKDYSLAWVDSFTPGITLRMGALRDDGSFRFTSVAELNGTSVTQVSLIRQTESGFIIETFNEAEGSDPALSMRLTYTPSKAGSQN